jgi:hypothetical protein
MRRACGEQSRKDDHGIATVHKVDFIIHSFIHNDPQHQQHQSSFQTTKGLRDKLPTCVI